MGALHNKGQMVALEHQKQVASIAILSGHVRSGVGRGSPAELWG